MKKFIYSLLLIFNLAANAQEVISIFDLPVITEADSNDIFIIARPSDTVTYKLSYENFTATLDSAIIANGDSITVHWSYIVALLDSISDLRDAIGTGGGNDTTVVDETPPQLISSIIRSAFPGITELYFDENIEYVSEDSVIYNFSYVTSSNEGSAITIDSCNYNLDTLFLFHDSLSATDIPYLVYFNAKNSGLQDASGNPVTFMSATVTNNIVDSASNTAIHAWGFNSSMEDAIGSADGTYANMAYAGEVIEGTASFDHRFYSGGMTGMNVGPIDFPDSGTFTMGLYPTDELGSTAMIFGNNNNNTTDPGIQCWLGEWNTSNNVIICYTTDGSTRSIAKTSVNAVPLNQWSEVAITYNPSELNIYVNDTLKSVSTDITDNFGEDGDMIIGNNEGYVSAFIGFIDNFQIHDKEFTAEEVEDFDFTVLPFDTTGGGGGGWVIDSLDVTVLWGQDWEDVELADTGLAYWNTGATMKQYFPPYSNRQSDYAGVQGFPDFSENTYPYPYGRVTTGKISMHDYSGNMVMRHTIDSGYYAGTYILLGLPGQEDDVWYTGNIRTKPNIDFVLGGKMGIGARSWTWDANPVTPSVEGFNNMLIFKSDSTKTSPQNQYYAEGLSHYLTYMNMPPDLKWGQSWTFDDTLQADGTREIEKWKIPTNGDWFNVLVHMRLNDPGVPNGFIEVWINGTYSHAWSGLKFRETSNTHIDIGRIAFYYGGGDMTFSTKRDEYMEIDDIYYFVPNSDKYFPKSNTPVDKNQYRTMPTINWPKD